MHGLGTVLGNTHEAERVQGRLDHAYFRGRELDELEAVETHWIGIVVHRGNHRSPGPQLLVYCAEIRVLFSVLLRK